MKRILTIFLSAVLFVAIQVQAKNNPFREPSKQDNKMENIIQITIGSKAFSATLEDSPTASAFKSLLPLEIEMTELNGNEKFYRLSKSIPVAAAKQTQIENGDIMLYGSNTIVLFYKTFSTSYSYTKLGRIKNPSELRKALGNGNATVLFKQR